MIPDTLEGVLKTATTDVNNLLPVAVGLIIAVACIPFAKRIVRNFLSSGGRWHLAADRMAFGSGYSVRSNGIF